MLIRPFGNTKIETNLGIKIRDVKEDSFSFMHKSAPQSELKHCMFPSSLSGVESGYACAGDVWDAVSSLDVQPCAFVKVTFLMPRH